MVQWVVDLFPVPASAGQCQTHVKCEYFIVKLLARRQDSDEVQWLERSLMVRWVVRPIPHGGPIDIFPVPASTGQCETPVKCEYFIVKSLARRQDSDVVQWLERSLMVR